MEDSTVWYFIQNFVWVPIVSAVIGFLLGILVPKIAARISKWWHLKISQQIKELSIAGDWNSFFHEEKSLQIEKVHFEQTGQEITGTISMPKKTYSFKGVFKNQIV